VDATLGAATLEVAIAPSRNSSNKLAVTRSGRPNLLGKTASIVAGLPCIRQRKNKATQSASTLGVVEVAPYASALQKLGRNRTDGSDLLGANAGIAAGLPCFWQKTKLH
jgi:hypothetical protein